MRIKNYTSFSEDKIREIIQFVKPNNLPTSNFDVKVTNTLNKYCGVFYEKGGYAKKGVGSDPNRPLVIARVTANERGFPLREDNSYRRSKENREKGKLRDWEKRRGGYIDSLILSREEALIHISSHEIRHFWQTNHPRKRGKVWGARGKYSERDADAYAIKKTRLWRRLHNPKDAMQMGRLNWQLIENDSFAAAMRL